MRNVMRTTVLLLCASCGAMSTALAADVEAIVGWSQRVELGTRVSGVVSDVHVRPGQQVNAGDKLITLDQRGFQGQVVRRQAEFRHAQAVLEEAEREDARAIELYDRTLLSDFERNQAAIALQSARAAAAAARALLLDARLDLEHSVVSAPFAGVVLAVSAAPGQSVISEMQSQPLVTIADDRVLQLRAEVGGDQASRLQRGQTLRVSARGESLQSTLDHVGFEPVGHTGQGPRYELTASLPVQGEMRLRVGESVTLHLD